MADELDFNRLPAQAPCVVLAGLDSLQGLQAARIYARRGVPVVGIAADRGHFCCRTRVCAAILTVSSYGDDLLAQLQRIAPGFRLKPVLLACIDEAVQTVARHRQSLQSCYHFALPDTELLETVMDKSRLYPFAAANSFRIPASYPVTGSRELAAAANSLGFPCLVKPGKRLPAWREHSAGKAFRVHSRDQLFRLYRECRHWCDVLVVQEWIPGGDDQLYSCNACFDADSRPLATFIARKLRQWPPQTGESCLGEECRNDEVLAESLRFFELIGLRGLGYLEMKRDPRDGRLVLIEPNIGRPTGRSAIAEAGGVELLYTLYCDLLGWPLPEKRLQTYGNTKWIHLVRDCVSALHYWRRGELNAAGWLQSLRGRKAYAVLDLGDPLPFCADLLRALHMLLSPHHRRRRQVAQRAAAAPPGAGVYETADS